jgi:hypothetical protein
VSYSLNDDLTLEQFEELKLSGLINPNATYADYLELKRERDERKREAEENGWIGCEPPDLTEEDEIIFVQMRDEARERELLPEALAA